jgi:3-deoxy-D-manno-octulosonate 8-phosphate phosphatase (KDO 8-P phosphatase)
MTQDSLLRPRLARLQLLCLDVDGVLTDGLLYWAGPGVFSQRFSVKDGVGIRLLIDAGVTVAILSAGDVPSGRDRARSLGLEHAFFGLTDKVRAFHELLAKLGMRAEDAAFMGDELSDLPLLREAGVSFTVPDAPDEVRAAVDYVTHRAGGIGAVREVADLIRAAKKA